MSNSSEEEEEEEPVMKKNSGFKMITKVAPKSSQDSTARMENKMNETMTTKINSYEVKGKRQLSHQPQLTPNVQEIPKKETESRTQVEEKRFHAGLPQEQSLVKQEQVMKEVQKETFQRTKLDQEQTIKEAQKRAQHEVQMRAQEAQARAKAKKIQTEAELKAQQEALQRMEQAKIDSQKIMQQGAHVAVDHSPPVQARAVHLGSKVIDQLQLKPEPSKSAKEMQTRREAQIKTEHTRAEQLRNQHQIKIMATEEAGQGQLQAQKLQQNQQPKSQQQQPQVAVNRTQGLQPQPPEVPPKRRLQPQILAKQPQQQQPQILAKQPQQQQPQILAKQPQQQQPQILAKQPQQQQPQHQQKYQAVLSKIQPTVPEKIHPAAPTKFGQVNPATGHEGELVQDVKAPSVSLATTISQQKPTLPVIPRDENNIRVMRGGDVQQPYLSKLSKPQELLPRREIKPMHTQDDQSWVTQSRVPVEIQMPQPAKITIPELHGVVEVKPTVIVPRPAQTTRVEWNEFPKEEVKVSSDVPRMKTGEWHPDRQVSEIVQTVRNAYQPGRIRHVWPPPQNEFVIPREKIKLTKMTDDTAWIRNERIEMETGTAWGRAGPHNLRDQRVWPPQKNELRVGAFSGARLPVVQWPPPEFEQQIQQGFENLHSRLPIKPNQCHWPPPPSDYGTVVNQNEVGSGTQQIRA